jgi:phage tail-like protein
VSGVSLGVPRHTLASGLPAIFKPVLTRREADVVRAFAEGRGLAGGDELVYESARAKLGVPLDSFSDPVAAAHEVVVRAREDDFITRLCDAFDEVLAPIVHSLDTLQELVTPAVCPPEFLPWLAQLVALKNYGDWPDRALRKLIANAVSLYRSRGTSRALEFVLELYAERADGGASVTIEDSGASWVSPDQPPARPARVAVRIRGARLAASDIQFRSGLEYIVSLFIPAHVSADVEVGA